MDREARDGGRGLLGRVAGPRSEAGAFPGPAGRAFLPLVAALLLAGLAQRPLDAQTGAPATALAQTSTSAGGLSEGERLFRENNPQAALPYLEQASRAATVDDRVWLWLAVCYQQVGRPDDGIATLRKGLSRAATGKDLLYFNLGNLFLIQGKASFAREMYDSAIAANASLGGAWLNRANAAILLGDLKQAREDYVKYLELEPSSSQRQSIQALIDRLGASIGEAEKQKAAADAAKLAEETARKALLDEVAASLKSSAEETTNLAAGSGQVQGYGDELPPSD